MKGFSSIEIEKIKTVIDDKIATIKTTNGEFKEYKLISRKLDTLYNRVKDKELSIEGESEPRAKKLWHCDACSTDTSITMVKQCNICHAIGQIREVLNI